MSAALPAGEVLDATLDVAREIARNAAPASVATTKRMFYEQLASSDRAASRALEQAAFRWFTTQPNAKEGFTSFLEKRSPQWTMSKTDQPPGS